MQNLQIWKIDFVLLNRKPYDKEKFSGQILVLWYNILYKDFHLPLMWGLDKLVAKAMPAESPPPPTGTTMASKSGTCSKNSTAIVALKTKKNKKYYFTLNNVAVPCTIVR